MRSGLIVFSICLILAVAVYSWLNRDSDRVILTLVTAMTLGALGFITKESISNKEERISKIFPIAVFYGLPNYRPLNINLPYHHDLSMCLQELQPDDLPKEGGHVDIAFGQDIYFDALELVIVKEIFKRFSQGWNVAARQTKTPNGISLSWRSLGDQGDEVLLSDVANQLSGNYFVNLGVHDSAPRSFGGKAILPPGTKISIHREEANKMTIKLTNTYVDLSISLTRSASSMGIGEYARLLGVGRNQAEVSHKNSYANSVYILDMEAVQTLWLNGNPNMKAHRNWADSIFELLDSTFNFENISEDHIRQFQLYGPDGIKAI